MHDSGLLEEEVPDIKEVEDAVPELQRYERKTAEKNNWSLRQITDSGSFHELGRSWNAYRADKYILPDDEQERCRLDIQHEVWRISMNEELSWVPFEEEPRYVLDVGTGTGIWAIEWAEKHPNSKVIGTDISVTQWNESENCFFIQEDAEDEWLFGHKFDYIHFRAMLTSFWDNRRMVQKVFDNLNPGGWVEYQELFPTLYGFDAKAHDKFRHSDAYLYWEMVVNGSKAHGVDATVATKYKHWLTEIGFVDVVERKIPVPINSWPSDKRQKIIGSLMAADASLVIDCLGLRLAEGVGISLEEYKQWIPQVEKSWCDKSLQGCGDLYVVYGRKPLVDKC